MNYMSAGIIAAIAFVAGAFVSSPDLRAFAAASITSGDIVDGTIQSVDIKNGAVANADLAPNAVTTSKINDGAVKSADIGIGEVKRSNLGDSVVSASKIGIGEVNSLHITDDFIITGSYSDGEGGWTPDGIKISFDITHGIARPSSVILINLAGSNANCSANQPIDDAKDGEFRVVCNAPPLDGSVIQFVVINP